MSDGGNGMDDERDFRVELMHLINCYSKENSSDTPEFILADYLLSCLESFDAATKRRTEWYGRCAT